VGSELEKLRRTVKMAKRLLAKEEYMITDPEILERFVLYEKEPEKKIARIIFNRPEMLNALPIHAFDRVAELVRDAEMDDDVKVIIFKGNGPCFGTGADADELGYYIGYGKGDTPEERRRPSQRRRMLGDKLHTAGPLSYTQTVMRCLKATICQVHGYCYGGHVYIAMASDIVIASEDAMFTHPAFRYLGPLAPFSEWILTIGLKRVKEMVLTMRPIEADEAERWGMVNRVVPLERLEQEVNDWAQAISIMPIDSLCVGKALIEANLEAMGIGVGYWTEWAGHGWTTNQRFEPGEWNFMKARRDKGLSAALDERDRMVAPFFRMGKEARKEK